MNNNVVLERNSVEWIGVRFLDINSNTFYYNNNYYKAILPTAEEYVKNESYDAFLESLYNEKFIPKTKRVNISIEGYLKTYLQHTEYFNFHLSFASPLVVKEAALLYINMNLWLYKRGFVVIDGHVGNFVIQKLNAPFWCDIGSFRRHTKENELAGIDEFIRYFLYPLLLRQKCFSLGDMMRWGLTNGISHAAASALQLLKQPIVLAGSREDIFVRLKEIVSAIEFPWEKTLWSDYGMRVDIDTSIPDIVQGGHHRKAMIMRLLKTLAPKTVIDLGANAGGFSRLAASLGAEVLALEPDDTAIARGHLHLREFGADNSIKFIRSRLFQVHQSADVAIALALTHHVFLTDKYSWKNIAQILAKHCKKHLITEFMPNGLGGKEKQKNLPDSYTLENFVEQLKLCFEAVEVIDYSHLENASPRILLLCTNKKEQKLCS